LRNAEVEWVRPGTRRAYTDVDVTDEEADMMLRITLEETLRPRATLRLEGSVAGEWVALLERECIGLLRAWVALILDLKGVGFVDRAGVEVLRRLGRAGVEIRGCSGTVESVLEGEGIIVARDSDGVDDGQEGVVPSEALKIVGAA
jgi:hypothetical protein